jgi:alkanesulfonate monooxygenase SsuD/methylene tetrahydromethanopterin reductase-like flavin-dependent oxidoreductase (luciferase family)
MRHGVSVANIGTYADARAVARLAAVAEEAGWEGLFVWDHLGFVWDGNSGDPWMLLTAAAAATNRMLLGTAITPVPRRRLQVLAMQVATLDLMSGGRTVFGAGIGGVRREFSAFGEPDDKRVRAEKLDEGLEVLDRLWSGEPVTHHGTHYNVENITLAPSPGRGRIPIWIGGRSAAALRRAARWDGWIAESDDGRRMTMTAAELADRTSSLGDVDVAVVGYSELGDTALRDEYAQAGATWWLESIHDRRDTFDAMLDRVRLGPGD